MGEGGRGVARPLSPPPLCSPAEVSYVAVLHTAADVIPRSTHLPSLLQGDKGVVMRVDVKE